MWPQRLQHTRLPCSSLSPWVCSNSCPLSLWCHPTISSSVAPLSSCPQSFPASRSFPMSQFFASGDRSIGASPSASVFPMNIQSWFPLGWTGLISLVSKGLWRVFCSTTVLWHLAFLMVHLSHPYMTTRKTKALTRWTFVGKMMSLFFNTLSRFVITFLPRSRCLLISQIIPKPYPWPGPWKKYLPQNQFLVPKKFGDHCSKKRKNHRQYTCPKWWLYEKITVRQWPPACQRRELWKNPTAGTLILNLQPLELRRGTFLLFKPPGCGIL